MSDFSKYEVAPDQAHDKITVLAQMDELTYGMHRAQAAKDLKINLKTLDSVRKEERSKHLKEANGDIVERPRPWHAAVDPNLIANYLEENVTKHIALKHPEYATAITLWSLSTWLIDSWKIMPHLFFRSLTKGSGKTTALHIVEAFSVRAYVCANITPAALFRVIEEYKPTLFLDEVDRYLATQEELNGIMNAGHTRRTARVTRLEEVKGKYIPRNFNVFGGKCMAGIGRQMDTMMDRSIVIKMEKRLFDEPITKLPLTFFEDQYELRQQIARFAEDNHYATNSITTDIPNLGNDRSQDNWQPLFTVAELIGGSWPAKCLAAYKRIESISAEDAKEQDSVVIRILRELAPKIEKRRGAWLPAEELRSMLISDEEGEFFDWYQGNPITPKSIKKYLVKEAEVTHERQSSGSVYSLTDIRELVKRYVHD